LSRQTATEVTRIPLLGEIPFFGPLLFNTKRSTEDELELLVLVTPEIVRAMDPDQVPPMPGYYVTHPNDRELYRYAMTEGAPDLEVYQLAPYGNKVGTPDAVGFNVYNKSPATPQNGPIPQANQPNGFPTPSPWTEQNMRNPGQGTGFGMGMSPEMQHFGMPNQQMDPRMMGQPMMAPQGQYYQQQQQQHQPQYAPHPGYQQAPSPYQGNPQMMPSPDPGVQQYRSMSMPTAGHSNQSVPNYNQQLFQQGGVRQAQGQTYGASPQGNTMPAGYSQPR